MLLRLDVGLPPCPVYDRHNSIRCHARVALISTTTLPRTPHAKTSTCYAPADFGWFTKSSVASTAVDRWSVTLTSSRQRCRSIANSTAAQTKLAPTSGLRTQTDNPLQRQTCCQSLNLVVWNVQLSDCLLSSVLRYVFEDLLPAKTRSDDTAARRRWRHSATASGTYFPDARRRRRTARRDKTSAGTCPRVDESSRRSSKKSRMRPDKMRHVRRCRAVYLTRMATCEIEARPFVTDWRPDERTHMGSLTPGVRRLLLLLRYLYATRRRATHNMHRREDAPYRRHQ